MTEWAARFRLKFIKAAEISAVLEMDSESRATHINRSTRGENQKEKTVGEREDEEGDEKTEQRKRRKRGKESRSGERKPGRVANESDNSVCRAQTARGMQPPALAPNIHKFIPVALSATASFHRLTICRRERGTSLIMPRRVCRRVSKLTFVIRAT